MEKILVVDDSAVQAAQLKEILDDAYDITTAHTAEDGLRLASRDRKSTRLNSSHAL